MLDFLRKRAQSLVIQAIVVVIALVFIFWGVGTNMMNQQEVAIVVNGEEISFGQFQQAYDQTQTRIAQQFGGTIPKELVEVLNIRQQVINNLVQETLLRQGGRAMGLAVSSAEIQQEIESMVQFQENGAFSLERYESILAANRLSPTKYEESLRHDLLDSKTVEALSAFVTSVSDAEIEDLYTLENETLRVEYAVISPADYLSAVEVTEEPLAAWYEANGSTYLTEKKISLTYLPFEFSTTANKIDIDDAAISAYYEQHQESYKNPETRQARHILFRVAADATDETRQEQRRQAEEVLEKARAGEDFATLARDHSEDSSAENGGDLGFFSKGQMVKPFEDAVFAMQVGEVSDIVETDFGFHLIKLEAVEPAQTRSLDQVREEIVTTLRMEQAKPLTSQLAGSVYEQIIGAGSLAAYLEAHPETVVVKTDFFARSQPSDQMVADPAFLDTAFSLKAGELSSITETADGYAIIYVEAIQEPQVPALADVRQQVEQDYRQERAEEKAKSVAQQIIDSTQAGKEFASIVQELGLTVQQSGPLSKNTPDEQAAFPQQLVPDAFRLTAASPVVAEPKQVGDDFYVFRFIERRAPEQEISAEDRELYRDMLLQFRQRQLVDAWLKQQQQEAKVSIHKSLQDS